MAERVRHTCYKSVHWQFVVHARMAKSVVLQRAMQEELEQSLVGRVQGKLPLPFALRIRQTGKEVLTYSHVSVLSPHQALARFSVRQSSQAEAYAGRCSRRRLCEGGYA